MADPRGFLIGGTGSVWDHVTGGVPQGSMLGPVILSLFNWMKEQMLSQPVH